MPKFVYNGDQEVRELWGVEFPRGKAVPVSDPALAQKCRGLGFVEDGAPEVEAVEADTDAEAEIARLTEQLDEAHARIAELEGLLEEAKAEAHFSEPDEYFEPAPEDDPDLEIPHRGAEKPEDYVAAEVEAEETVIPTLGEGVLPDNWRGEHWKTRQAWCRELLGLEVANGTEADAALEKALIS